jgi:hypothetical protein
MLAHMRPLSLLGLAVTLASAGCGKGEECTKARLAASESWRSIMTQAGDAKLRGGPDFEELPETKKAEHVKVFTSLETQSDMVFKSFAFEKITWKTADPARQETNSTFSNYFGRDNFTVFSAALKTANQKYEDASKVCRD